MFPESLLFNRTSKQLLYKLYGQPRFKRYLPGNMCVTKDAAFVDRLNTASVALLTREVAFDEDSSSSSIATAADASTSSASFPEPKTHWLPRYL